MKPFASPDRSLGALETDAVAKLIATAADVALILDRDGIVVDVAFHREEFGVELSGSPAWIGRRWTDIVTPESRDKVATLLAEATQSTVPRWRQINHATAAGRCPSSTPPCRSATDGWWRSGETSRRSHRSSSDSSRRSNPWSATIRSCGSWKCATGCCSRCRSNPSSSSTPRRSG